MAIGGASSINRRIKSALRLLLGDGFNGRISGREVKILMRLPDGRNVVTRQAVHGSVPCARTEVTGRWLVLPQSSVATPCLNASVSWPACVGERH